MKLGSQDAEIIRRVLEETDREVAVKRAAAKDGKLKNPSLTYALAFNKFFGAELVAQLARVLHVGDRSKLAHGETPSSAARGKKRVDVLYSTPESGLELMVSMKSVHRGERDDGNTKFTHNLKRNDEELRVEATEHHIRQPYAVLAAMLFLPFESCQDIVGDRKDKTSSFAAWVRYLWPLQDRVDPRGRPDCFELVFIALYARDGSALGFHEVRGKIPCPRLGPPPRLLSFSELVDRLKEVHAMRNSKTFSFEGEDQASEA